MGFGSVRYFGCSCLITIWVFKLMLLLYTKVGTTKNCSISRQRVNDARNNYFYELLPFYGCQNLFFCFQVILHRTINRTSLWKFVKWCLFVLFKFPSRRFTIHSQRNLKSSFGQDSRKRLLHLWEKDWNTWRVERFCVFIVQNFLLVHSVRDMKLWGNGSGVRTITQSIVCSRRQVNQQMIVGYRRCVWIPIS